MSVVIFHPSTAHFVQQAARSLYEAGELDRFITSVLDRPQSLVQRAAGMAGRLIDRDLGERFRRRAVTEIPPEKTASCGSWTELLRLASGSLDKSGRLTDAVWEMNEKSFDRGVAHRIHPGLTAVYGFEYGSLHTFQRAHRLGIKTIYEVPAAESRFVQRVLNRELDRFPELRTAYHRHTAAREERRIARRREEWENADLVIVASAFTRSTYAQAQRDVTKVRVVPLGAPPPAAKDAVLRSGQTGEPLRLLWAGGFNLAKGAHYLLEAWQQHGFDHHARLEVYGTVALPERILASLPAGITLHGPIPRAELMERYGEADALLFPTLCDGFGMVVTEAFSRGLPVITTDHAGAGDLVRPGQNGLLIPAGDAGAIAEAIEWCLSHRAELRAMREPALATAAAWQWSDYRRAHADILRTAGMFTPT